MLFIIASNTTKLLSKRYKVAFTQMSVGGRSHRCVSPPLRKPPYSNERWRHLPLSYPRGVYRAGHCTLLLFLRNSMPRRKATDVFYALRALRGHKHYRMSPRDQAGFTHGKRNGLDYILLLFCACTRCEQGENGSAVLRLA